MNRHLQVLRVVLRAILVLVTSLLFLFALFSGAETQGGGVEGMIKNSPNALPWVILALLVWMTFRRQRIGGMLVSAAGVYGLFFFHAWHNPVVFSVLMAGVILPSAGLALLPDKTKD